MSPGSILEHNLRRLRARHPALAERLARADDGGIERVTGPRGSQTLREAGVQLGSSYDPAAEGERLAKTIAAEEPDLVVLLGLGLGHHVASLLRQRDVPLVVFEPSAARLRAALATTACPWIDAPAVHWAADPAELPTHFRALYTPGLRVRTFVHPALARLEPVTARELVQRVARAKDEADVTTFTRVRQTAKWSRRAVENLPRLLETPSASALFGAFRGVPAVVVAAGPSLDSQLPRLARHADRLLVIAIGQSLGALRSAGISPDLVHVIDGPDVSHQLRAEGDPSALDLVLFPSVHPRVFEVPARTRFVSYPATNPVACWMVGGLGETHFVLGGATVAQSAVHLAAALGANPILLVGQDLAFSGGRVYATGSAYERVSFRETDSGRFVFTHFDEKLDLVGQAADGSESAPQELVWVEGWSGERVPTSRGYASFIEQYGQIGAALASQGIRLVNCTEGGARIPGLEHRGFEETVERCAREPVRARETIRSRFAAATRPSPAPLRDLARETAHSLDHLEREARRALAQAHRAGSDLRKGRGAETAIGSLRRLARAERRVERALAPLPWLEALVQPERQEEALAAGRAGGDPSPEGCVEQARRRLETALTAVERGRGLLERLNLHLSPAEPARKEPAPPLTSVAAGR